MGYLYGACDQISDFCYQYLLRKIFWDGQTEDKPFNHLPSGKRGYNYLRCWDQLQDIQIEVK